MSRNQSLTSVAHIEPKPVMNPLWVITIGMGIFFAAIAAVTAMS